MKGIRFIAAAAIVLIGVGSLRAEDPRELLKREAGTWEAEVKMYMPGSEGPVTSKGTETNRIIGEGVWLISEFNGDFGGTKFTGFGEYGYDPVKKKYVGAWVDSMTPFLSTMEGEYDPSTKSLTMMSKGRDVRTGKEITTKMVTKYESDTERSLTMLNLTPDGKEVKMMEINYTKK
ncbi:hypothetical protein Pan216_10340 [Planctomycetes bacterium Pan216]|uniref:DUF1579 domain-containing protein n=1 Tax=Kolteria novifilia TaxID=2527975 RepID=A0A518AZQ2_9BACT|nr:hypothetical protein Pan216_10340 [Planctomycetes bacterium Pan216]